MEATGNEINRHLVTPVLSHRPLHPHTSPACLLSPFKISLLLSEATPSPGYQLQPLLPTRGHFQLDPLPSSTSSISPSTLWASTTCKHTRFLLSFKRKTKSPPDHVCPAYYCPMSLLPCQAKLLKELSISACSDFLCLILFFF